MQGELASIKETIHLTPRETLEEAWAFLGRSGYNVAQRTHTTLTVEREQSIGFLGRGRERFELTVRAEPQPAGGVRVSVAGTDSEGLLSRQDAWNEWAERLRAMSKERQEAKTSGDHDHSEADDAQPLRNSPTNPGADEPTKTSRTEDLYYKLGQAARLLGKDAYELNLMIHQQKLPVENIRGLRWVPKQAVEELLGKLRRPATPNPPEATSEVRPAGGDEQEDGGSVSAQDSPAATARSASQTSADPAGRSGPDGAVSYEELRRVCRRYDGAGYYLGDVVAEKKLQNARVRLSIPDEERIVALLDTTVFGSSKTGMAICEGGIYWREMLEHEERLSWAEVASATIRRSGRYEVEVGEGNTLRPGVAMDEDEVLQLLGELSLLWRSVRGKGTGQAEGDGPAEEAGEDAEPGRSTDEPLYYEQGEVARLLGKDPGEVGEMMDLGRLPALVVNGSRWVPKEAVEVLVGKSPNRVTEDAPKPRPLPRRDTEGQDPPDAVPEPWLLPGNELESALARVAALEEELRLEKETHERDKIAARYEADQLEATLENVRMGIEEAAKDLRTEFGNERARREEAERNRSDLRAELDEERSRGADAPAHAVEEELEEMRERFRGLENELEEETARRRKREEWLIDLQTKLEQSLAERKETEEALGAEREKARRLEEDGRVLGEIRCLLGQPEASQPSDGNTTEDEHRDGERPVEEGGGHRFDAHFVLEEGELALLRLLAEHGELTVAQLQQKTGRRRAPGHLDALIDRFEGHDVAPVVKKGDRYVFDPSALQSDST